MTVEFGQRWALVSENEVRYLRGLLDSLITLSGAKLEGGIDRSMVGSGLKKNELLDFAHALLDNALYWAQLPADPVIGDMQKHIAGIVGKRQQT